MGVLSLLKTMEEWCDGKQLFHRDHSISLPTFARLKNAVDIYKKSLRFSAFLIYIYLYFY